MQDYSDIAVRAATSLTSSYVAGTIIGRNMTSPNHIYVPYNDQLVLKCNYTIGALTTLTIKVEFAEELFYQLPYDGQSGNFTVGLTVKGGKSKAKGVIIKDTDGGASGTLVVGSVQAGENGQYFIDNEPLTDTSTGVAVVNGAMDPNTATVDDISFYQETAESVSGGTATNSSLEHSRAATGRFRMFIPIKDRFIRVSAKGNATDATSLLSIRATLGTMTGTY